jgi:iron-sulfur cluster assembly protein
MQGILLTETAAKEIERALSLKNGYNGIRIEVQGGGCSGYRYNMSLDSTPRPGDDISEHHGVKLYYNAILFKSLLDGMTVDFIEGLMGGFKFLNPNATASCGCGESFAG